jgi:uncharacterized protein (TIGR02147 family)
MVNNIKAKPVLFDYISATSYLHDLMSFRKSENPGFTFECWAHELGFKSRSFMKMILNKERNITSKFIEVFAESMSFSTNEKAFFSLLVQYNQTESETEKLHYLDRLLELQGKQKDLSEIINYNEFLRSTFLPKLLVLLSFKDLNRTAEGLASFLNEDVQRLENSLAQLQEMQLAFRNEEGQWISSKKSFKVPKSFGSEALERYHNLSLNEAIAAQRKPSEQRRFRSLLLPLSEGDYQNLLNDIEALISKTVAKYDSETLQEKSLYKLNLNLFPITEKFESANRAHNPENETRLFENKNNGDTDVII